MLLHTYRGKNLSPGYRSKTEANYIIIAVRFPQVLSVASHLKFSLRDRSCMMQFPMDQSDSGDESYDVKINLIGP